MLTAAAVASMALPATKPAECVVLIHGLGRSAASMRPVGRYLSARGYTVVSRSYPSTRLSVDAAADLIDRDIDQCRRRQATRIHFVTHSLGGLLLRRYFQDHEAPEASRAVMLGPPNAGSEIADELKHHWWFRAALGPAGQALGAREPLTFSRPLPLEVGVIAGTRNYEPWFASCFNGRPNDGKVSVESTRLAEMADFLTVRAGHTFMIRSDEVQGQVAAFLESGRFAH